ncbi:hypothetical protein ACIGMX_06670 [Streptomyces aquilus]|uniref:hypothetical protein n=1 Tax=Streptomyces aquilus TaxID=2548456 RepID=UPI0037D2EC69
MLFDVFQDGRSQGDFAGEGGDERVLGGHGLRVTDAVCQPCSGNTGEDERHARKDGIPAQPCRAGGGGSAAVGFVLEQPGVLDQFHGQAFAAHGGAVDLDEGAQFAPMFALDGHVVQDLPADDVSVPRGAGRGVVRRDDRPRRRRQTRPTLLRGGAPAQLSRGVTVIVLLARILVTGLVGFFSRRTGWP